jgi:ketosteroid isomerase-like protein
MDSSMSESSQAKLQVDQVLRQMNDDWVKALVRGDGAALDRIMADDFVFSYPLEGDDKAQFIDDVTNGALKVEHITRSQLSVRVFGATAILTALDSATWLYHGREFSGQYKILHVYAERDGHWKLCAVQACPIHP